MKTLFVTIPRILIVVFLVSCADEKDCCVNLEDDGKEALLGEWLLYERGYSPGSGYFVDPVSPVPPQVIEFKGNRQFSSTVEGLKGYKFFAVKDDVVGLFNSDPGPEPDNEAFTHSYNFSFENGNLKLAFRFCFEGCHLGFKKVE